MRISDWSSDVCSSDLPHGPTELIPSVPFGPTARAKPIRPIMNLAPFFPSSCDPTKPPALRYSPHESKPTTFCSPGLRHCHAAHGTSSYRTAHLAPAGGAYHDDARCVARDHPGRDVLVRTQTERAEGR